MITLHVDHDVRFSDLYNRSSIMFVDNISLNWNKFLTEENEPLPGYSNYSDDKL